MDTPEVKAFESRNPDFREEVNASFRRQAFMSFLQAKMQKVDPGFCEIYLPFRDDLSQQHGFFHGGVIGTLADNAGGYAAYSLMSPNDSVLTVEYKLNIVAPGKGEALIARGYVLRAGKTLTVCRSDIYALQGDDQLLCATSLQTLMCMSNRPDHLSREST